MARPILRTAIDWAIARKGCRTRFAKRVGSTRLRSDRFVPFGFGRAEQTSPSALWQARTMNTSRLDFVKLLACLCVGAALLAGCASSSSGSVYVPSVKKCDPTGDSEARRACNN
jgi:hypothetical protein